MALEPIIRKTVLALIIARDWTIAQAFFAGMWFLKLFSPEFAINTAEKIARTLGPLYPRSKQARENITLAFPEKTEAERKAILVGMWGNLGRTAAEYVYLDKIFDINEEDQSKGRVEIAGSENFEKLKAIKGTAICFTGHTGNWEILPVGSAAFGVHITALFRPPNNRFIAKRVLSARTTSMGHTVPSKAGASWALANVMDGGGKVGLLVDQFFKRGVLIDFFGHKTIANPLLAKLAKQYDCPVFPARCIRLPNGRFRLEIQDPVDIPRLENGKVDTDELTVRINEVIEDWVREYPEQWLWLHRKWRPRHVEWHKNRKEKWAARRKAARSKSENGKQP